MSRSVLSTSLLRIISLAGLCGLLTGHASPPRITSIKLLVIGNSYTANTIGKVPDFAKADGKTLILQTAILGGAALEKHVEAARLYQDEPTNPAGRPYHDSIHGSRPYSLIEALDSDSWDFVSIQELVGKASRPGESYPAFSALVELVRQHAPKARILLLEPWSPREDGPPDLDGLTSAQRMYQKVHNESIDLCHRLDLALLPIGTAFQNARNTAEWHYAPDPDFNYHNPPPGKLPRQDTSLNIGWQLHHDQETGKERLTEDRVHCNAAGGYLAAAVLYDYIFADDVRRLSPACNDLTAPRARSLREIAHAAVTAARGLPASPAGTP